MHSGIEAQKREVIEITIYDKKTHDIWQKAIDEMKTRGEEVFFKLTKYYQEHNEV